MLHCVFHVFYCILWKQQKIRHLLQLHHHQRTCLSSCCLFGFLSLFLSCPSSRSDKHRGNAKLKGEYRRLLKPLCLRGLFKWRRCALALRRAGLSVQSGTIPVERHWSQFITLFPPATKRVSLKVFELFAGLAMLRFNWVHYHKPWCPPWACSDTLLQQKADAVLESEGMAALQKELTEICTAAVSNLPLAKRRRR